MTSICIISSHAPYGSTLVRDGIETLLVAASYDFEAALLVLGEGVLQLLESQSPDALPQKNTASMAQALELYGVEKIYVCREDLVTFGLDERDLLLSVQLINHADVADLLQNYDHVLSF